MAYVHIPAELLSKVCSNLEGLKDIQNFRLVNKEFSGVGLEYLMPILSLSLTTRDLDRMAKIAEHPALPRYVSHLKLDPTSWELADEHRDYDLVSTSFIDEYSPNQRHLATQNALSTWNATVNEQRLALSEGRVFELLAALLAKMQKLDKVCINAKTITDFDFSWYGFKGDGFDISNYITPTTSNYTAGKMLEVLLHHKSSQAKLTQLDLDCVDWEFNDHLNLTIREKAMENVTSLSISIKHGSPRRGNLNRQIRGVGLMRCLIISASNLTVLRIELSYTRSTSSVLLLNNVKLPFLHTLMIAELRILDKKHMVEFFTHHKATLKVVEFPNPLFDSSEAGELTWFRFFKETHEILSLQRFFISGVIHHVDVPYRHYGLDIVARVPLDQILEKLMFGVEPSTRPEHFLAAGGDWLWKEVTWDKLLSAGW